MNEALSDDNILKDQMFPLTIDSVSVIMWPVFIEISSIIYDNHKLTGKSKYVACYEKSSQDDNLRCFYLPPKKKEYPFNLTISKYRKIKIASNM